MPAVLRQDGWTIVYQAFERGSDGLSRPTRLTLDYRGGRIAHRRRFLAMSDSRALVLPAPAKLNLFLHVTGRREDGYHTLESVLVLIARGDVVAARRCATTATSCGYAAPHGVPAERRPDGARGPAAATGTRRHAWRHDRGDKRVPIGGGLGGGSSDAATVLLGLNRLWRLRLTRHESDGASGVELGADVPFFVFGETARARGIGEVLRGGRPAATWFVVLVAARSSVSTGGDLRCA